MRRFLLAFWRWLTYDPDTLSADSSDPYGFNTPEDWELT